MNSRYRLSAGVLSLFFLWNCAGPAQKAAPSPAPPPAAAMGLVAARFPDALARFGKWEEILQEPAPPADLRFSTGVWQDPSLIKVTRAPNWAAFRAAANAAEPPPTTSRWASGSQQRIASMLLLLTRHFLPKPAKGDSQLQR